MSSIDQRVVEMQFDNQQFEKGVQTSVKSLEDLKKGLNLDESARSLSSLEKAGKSFSLAGIADTVDAIGNRFSNMGIIGVTALQNIVNKAVDAGTQLIKSLSIDQITSGFGKYEQEVSAVQTIMNATGKSMEEVQSILDKLGWYSDETSYSYTDMINTLGKFTSAGVGLDEASTAMEGIANWAALSGVNANDAQRAFFNLAQAMSTGTVRMQDWKSIELLNMSTPEFKQMAINAAIAQGAATQLADGQYVASSVMAEAEKRASKVKKKTDKERVRSEYLQSHTFDVNSMSKFLSDDWFSKDVLMGVLNEYGQYADEVYKYAAENGLTAAEAMEQMGDTTMDLGEKAFKAAQEAKTFTDAINATKDAVSTGWKNTFSILFGNYEEAKVLWTDLAGYLYDLFAESGNQRNAMLQSWKDMGGRTDLTDAFYNIMDAITNVVAIVKEAFDNILPPMTAEKLKGITEGIKAFSEKIKAFTEDSEKMDKVRRIFEGLASVVGIVKMAISGLWNIFKKLLGVVFPEDQDFLETIAKIADKLTELKTKLEESGMAKIGETLKSIFQPIQKVGEQVPDESVIGKLKTFFSGIITAIRDFVAKASGLELSGVLLAIFGVLLSTKLVGLIKSITGIGKSISEGFSNIGSAIGKAIGQFSKKDVTSSIYNISASIAMLASALAVVSQIEPDRLVGALAALGVMLVAVVGLTFFLSKVKVNKAARLAAVSSALVILGAAMILFAEAVGRLGKLSGRELVKGIAGLGFVMLEIAAFMALTKKAKLGVFKMASLILLAVSLNMFAEAIAKLGRLRTETLVKGISGLGFVLLELAVFMALTQKAKFGLFQGVAMILLARAVVGFAEAIKMLGVLDTDTIKRGVIGLGAVLLELVIFMALTRKMNSDMAGFAMISALGNAVKEIAGALIILGELNAEQMKNGVIGLGAVLLELAAFMKLTQKVKMGILNSAGLILLAYAVKGFAESVAFLGKLQTDEIKNGLIGLGGVLLELAIFLALTRKARMGVFKGTGLILLAYAIKGFAEAIAFIGQLDSASMIKGMIGLGVVMLELAVFLALTKKAKIGVFKGLGLVLLAVSLNLFARAISAIGSLDTATILKGVIGLGLVMLELAVFLALTKKANIGVFKGIALILLAVALNEFGNAISKIGKLKTSQIIKGVLGLGSVLALLVGFMKVISKFKISGVGKALLVLGIMSVAMIAFALVLTNIKDVDPSVMLGFSTSLGIALLSMAASLAIISALPISAILLGIAKLALVFAAIVGLMALFGALEEWLNLSSLINKFGDLLSSIGNAFGRFISGFVTGAVTGLAGVGTELSNFMTNAQTFIDGVKQIDDSVVTGTGNLVSVITSIAAANVIDAIAGWLTGRSSMETFADDVAKLGAGIAAYATAVSGITDVDEVKMENATAAAEGLVALSNSLSPEGGIVQWFTGTKDLSGFAKDIPTLGTALNTYVQEIDAFIGKDVSDKIANANAAATGIAELNNNLQPVGGVTQWFTGTKDLSKFSSDIPALALALNSYIDGISAFIGKDVSKKLENANTAAIGIATLNNNLQPIGGVAQWFTGTKSLSVFANDIPLLASALNTYIESIDAYNGKGVTKKVENANTAAIGIATLNNNLQPIGGVAQWFTGTKSLSLFANDIPALALALNTYVEGIGAYSGKDVSKKVENANAAATGIATLNNSLQPAGGVAQWFAGTKDLKSFAENIPELALALNTYAQNIEAYKGKDVGSQITNINAAAEGIATLNNSLHPAGGVSQWFSGTADLQKFAENIPSLAIALNLYAENIGAYTGSDISDKIKNVNSAAMGIATLNNSLQPAGGVSQWFSGTADLQKFAENIPDLALALNTYAKNIDEYTGSDVSDKIKNVNEAADGLATLNNSLSPVGGVAQWFTGTADLTGFAEKVPSIGASLSAFATAIADADMSKSDAAIVVLGQIQSFISGLETSGGAIADVAAWFGGDTWRSLQTITNGMGLIGTTFSTYATGIGSVDSTSSDKATTILTNFATFLNGLGVSGGAIADIGAWFGGDTYSTLVKILDAMSNVGTKFKTFSDGIGGATTSESCFESVKQLITNFQSLAESLHGKENLYTKDQGMDKIIGSLEAFGKKMNSFGMSMTDVEKVKAASEVVAILMTVAADAASVSPENVRTIGTVLDEFGSLDFETLKALFNENGTGAGDGFTSSIATAIQNGTEAVITAATNLSGEGYAAIGNTLISWSTTGNNLAIGLANGISAMAWRVRTAAINTAAGAIRSIQIKWSVHSPSKVGEDLGMNWDLGIAGGIDRYAKVVSVSAERIGDNAIQSTQAVMRGYTLDALKDLDMTPTIRPVIDISDVRNGVSTIDGLFNANRSLSSGMFAGKAFNQNAAKLNFDGAKILGGSDNRDVVGAINELTERFNDLSEAVANMKMVTDTGVLVGEIDQKIDQRLGVLAGRKGRGN